MTNDQKKILKYVRSIISKEGEPLMNIDEHTLLLGQGIINSVNVLEIISFLEYEFSVKIETEDLSQENFASIVTIYNLLLHHQGK